ncbi:MAG: hypothetical protein WCI77_01080 [Candidatus Omnitrophota bacterium]
MDNVFVKYNGRILFVGILILIAAIILATIPLMIFTSTFWMLIVIGGGLTGFALKFRKHSKK